MKLQELEKTVGTETSQLGD